MKKIIVANWKANKTIPQAASWVGAVKNQIEKFENLQIVVCSSYVLLPGLRNLLADSQIKLGAQNVSHLGQGAFTGEVSVEMLEVIVGYCIVGHSERKKYFEESAEQIVKKVEILLSKNIIPVLCVTDVAQLETYLSLSKEISAQAAKIIFVYEPPSAISGGKDYHPESPESADQVCRQFKEKLGTEVVTIYGGSVNPDNVASFLTKSNIQGVLPGQASLEAETFLQLLTKASGGVL